MSSPVAAQEDTMSSAPEAAGRPGPVLQRFTAEHLDAVQAMLQDPDVLAFTPIPEPVPPRHAERWLALPSWVALRSGVVAGVGMAPVADRERGEYELGYLVAREHRGHGVATALLRGMTRWALEDGAQRIALHISAGNAASHRVAERLGYVREGVLRSTWLKAGRREDSVVWSLLPSDPLSGA